MSSLIVEVCEVQKISPHPDADRLRILHVKGWQVVTASPDVQEGQKVIYVPPDSILSEELAVKWGVLPYLKQMPLDTNGNRPTGGRVSVARLRGVHSFGFTAPVDDPAWPVGLDVAAHYGIGKYEPPPECLDGDAAREVPTFHKYTGIENYRNFPNVVRDGEEVVFTEKLHGKNSRVGLVRAAAEDGSESFEFMAGSHGVRRKEFDKDDKRSEFWSPLTENVKEMLKKLSGGVDNVVLFGEIFGSGVQDMAYGLTNGGRDYRAFDIAVNGAYLDYDAKVAACEEFKVKTVPVLFRGPFSKEMMAVFTTGPTTACDPTAAGKFKGREGVVIHPVKERTELPVGRVILKSISPDYQLRKTENATEFR